LAQTKTTKVSSKAPAQPSVAEIKEWYAKNKDRLDLATSFADNKNKDKMLKQLRDIGKTYTKTVSTFDKEKLRTYLQNIGSQEKNLRALSWYLLYRSHIYYRIVNFFSQMFCLDCRSIIPKYDFIKENSPDKIAKIYQNTLDAVGAMRLQQEFYPIIFTSFVQDVYYGIYLHDETGVFHMQLPADYCKLAGKYMTGDFSFYFDASWLRNRQELLEYLPEAFEEIWKNYQSTGDKWQLIPAELQVCIKFRSEDYELIVPPFTGIFNSIINLSDLEDVQAAGDAASIYKMLWYELETISGSKTIDDWKIDPDLAIPYYEKFEDSVPDYIATAIVPGQIHEIDFDNDKASDTTKVAKATEQVLNTAGGAEVLNGATINNTYAFKMASIANTEFAISSILPQIQSWVARMLTYEGISRDDVKVRFMPISVYTKADYREQLLSSGQYGLPTKLAINTLNGFSEKDTMSLNYVEEEILGLSEKLRPLNSSYTQSGTEDGYTSEIGQGRPKVDDVGDLTDSGERTRGQSENG